MDIFETIRSEHEKVERLLQQMQETSSKAARKREQLLNHLNASLLPHMYAEEQYFYQVLLDETSEKEPMYEAFEEHRAAKMVLSDLQDASFDDPRWSARLKVLQMLIAHHVAEEEGTIFGIARGIMDGERAAAAVRRFKEMKNEAPAYAT
jgi:hemerythrin superfamily protein